ncbi:YvrJ family protein [Brevibacillus ruminantium]|uniref:YvrJ family protein n=1 Tax=Brevibacillus ruminantium TaxID=2950604 RepID=A0ABY4WL05_9BACL|nr:YvrJ family protein [Brevibacillus ruminantium]USG67777.1 YvrJ family protein [Brevibacillus ruminantium]
MINGDSELALYAQLIANVGFPIVVAAILLNRLLNGFNKRLDTLAQKMEELIAAIHQLATKERDAGGKSQGKKNTS